MPIPSALPWMKVHLFYAGDVGGEAENVLWFTNDEPLAGGFDAKVNAATIYAAFAGLLPDVLANNWSVLGAKISVNNGVYTTVNDVIESHAGTGGATSLPAESAVIVQAQCEVAGGSGKGRLFMPAVPEALTDGSRLSSGGTTTYQAIPDLLNAFIGGPPGTQWRSCVYSRKNNALQRVKFWELADVLCHRTSRRPRF